MDKPSIVIKVKGGMVTEVLSDSPVAVWLLDYDTEGVSEEDVVMVNGERCVPTNLELVEDGEFVERTWRVALGGHRQSLKERR